MMHTKKRKIILASAVAGFIVIVALTLLISTVLFFYYDDEIYTDFRAMQFAPDDLAQFGVSAANGDGLYSRALWIGEGYACTMEQDGQTGERMSVPYITWIVTNVNSSAGRAEIDFHVAERAFPGADVAETTSPWRYSNIEITLLAGDETGMESYYTTGCISLGNTALEDGASIPIEVAELAHGKKLSVENAEIALREKRQTQVFSLNASQTHLYDTQGIQVRLPENRSRKSKGYNLNGTIPEQRAVYGLTCDLWCYNRYASSKTEFPQTAHLKVTYDVENTVTGERTTHSTGWISRTYVSKRQ